MLVWNNNYETREEIERLYDKYKAQLESQGHSFNREFLLRH